MTAGARSRPSGLLAFQSASRTHPGRRRTLNEDRLLERTCAGLWAVADGMGGHRAGDAAAARLVEALERIEHGASGYACLADITGAVERVNADLFSEAQAAGGSPSGSTVVALLAHDGYYACLWAGDSRAYLLRHDQLTALTHDHSLVQELVDQGALGEEDRRAHPRANVITRAVGASPAIALDRAFDAIRDGDLFLLCSDGLTTCLDEPEIARALSGDGLEASADRLLAGALSRQAPDNVSFILIRASAP
jgi:serine/threonine protein phosphatase Stp1